MLCARDLTNTMVVSNILLIWIQFSVLMNIHCEKFTLYIGCLDVPGKGIENDLEAGTRFNPEINTLQSNNSCCCNKYWGVLIPKRRPFEGTGNGEITLETNLSLPGKASIGGALQVPGSVSFKGPVKATGSVTLNANYAL